jgi:uncharacterized protein YxeA
LGSVKEDPHSVFSDIKMVSFRSRNEQKDPLLAQIKQHYDQMGKDQMKISDMLSEQAQYEVKQAYMQKDQQVTYKMTLLKEVRQQKFLVTNRKTQFRINKTQVRKSQIAEEKKEQILKEYERKTAKGLAEGNEIYGLIVEVWTWQMRWIVSMKAIKMFAKFKNIREHRRF